MRKKYISVIVAAMIAIVLCGCGKEKELPVIYDVDGEVKKIVEVPYYPQELKSVSEQFAEEMESNSESLVDFTALKRENPDGEMVEFEVFRIDKYGGTISETNWLGTRWGVTPYINSYQSLITASRLMINFNGGDKEFATKKIREITSNFLNVKGDLIYQSNIYEFDVTNTFDAPINFILDVDEEYIVFYSIYMYGDKKESSYPVVDIFVLRKDLVHDISDQSLETAINTIKTLCGTVGKMIDFETIKLTAYGGYIVHKPIDYDNLSPEDRLLMGGAFYNE